jgi:hypothetical protein
LDIISKGVKPGIRMLYDMLDVIYDRKWLSNAQNSELYYMYRELSLSKKESIAMKEYGLRYDITVIPPRMLGCEFIKTAGHYHPLVPGTRITFPEIYEVMGDLNADCTYFKESDPSPLRSSDYYWIINNSFDTTTKSTDCTYDRIIITTPAITDYTRNSGVFRFDTAYNLNYDSTIAVSDHYPVYADFWKNRDTD